MNRVLIVEDDRVLAETLQYNLIVRIIVPKLYVHWQKQRQCGSVPAKQRTAKKLFGC